MQPHLSGQRLGAFWRMSSRFRQQFVIFDAFPHHPETHRYEYAIVFRVAVDDA
jgi:hypothetical protein